MSPTEYKRAQVDARREFAFAYLGRACVWPGCGVTDKVMLEFHHLDHREKRGSVSQMYGGSLKDLMAELDKCVVLCANHHRKTTADQKAHTL